jgi:hypothetical protein
MNPVRNVVTPTLMNSYDFQSISGQFAPIRIQLNRTARWLAALWVLQLLATNLQISAVDEWLVRCVPLIIFLTFGFGCYFLLKRCSSAFFTPFPIYFAWSAVVFGIGPLYQWFSPETAYRVNSRIFSYGVSSYVDVALLNTTGLLLTLIGASLMFRLLSHWRFFSSELRVAGMPGHAGGMVMLTNRTLTSVAFPVLLMSVFFKLILVFSNGEFSLPAFIAPLTRFGWLAVFLFGILAGRGQRNALIIALIITLTEGAYGLALGVRTEAIAPLVLLLSGYYLGSKSFKTLIVGFFITVFVLVAITPVVSAVRNETWEINYIGDRAAVVIDSLLAQNLNDKLEEEVSYSVWARFDYSPWQTVMMNRYDMGNAGDTYRYMLWTLVPRFLVPSKPIFAIGHDIGFAVQGVEGASSFSGTVYGEMYWNGGWLAVVVSSVVYGLLLAAVAVLGLWCFLKKRTIFAMILGLNAILFGFVVDETFSVSVVGKAIVFFAIFMVAYGRPRGARKRRSNLYSRNFPVRN